MAEKVYKGDIGTVIKLDTGQDISTATVKKIKYKKPSGARGGWTATLDGTKYLKYTTVANSLDQAGTWQLQAYVEMTSWSGHGGTVDMEVFDLFK